MARVLIVEDHRDLASLLATALIERGHEPHVATNGRDALVLADRTGFQAALVDLLLPDLRGTEVIRYLTDRGIPALAMSGVFRGAGFAEELAREHGAIALFEKPFDLRRLMGAVDELAGPANPPEGMAPLAAPPADLEEAVDVDPVEAENQAGALKALEAERRLNPRPSSGPANPAVMARPQGDLPFADRAVWQAPPPSPARPPTRSGGTPLSSSLTSTTVARLLTAAHQGKATGELRLTRDKVTKVVWIQEGKPVFAGSNVAAERYGRIVAGQGICRPEDLHIVQELAQREHLRTGETMVQLGLITDAQRVELLHLQARTIIWATFDWPNGDYRFVVRRDVKLHLAPLDLPLVPLVMDGYRRLPEASLTERLQTTQVLAPSQGAPFALETTPLEPSERAVLDAADGTKTVDDLCALSDLPRPRTMALLLACRELRLLEPKAPSVGRRIVLV